MDVFVYTIATFSVNDETYEQPGNFKTDEPMTKKQATTRLSFAWYAIPLAFVVIAGISDSLYLSISHFRNFTDLSYQSFCALSKAVNCDTVSQSRYAVLFHLPVATWGGLAYLFYLSIFIFAVSMRIKTRFWGLLTLMGSFFSLFSLYLALVSAFVIRSYCIMCIGLYGINMAAAFFPWLIFNRFGTDDFWPSLKKDCQVLFSTPVYRNVLNGLTVITLLVIIFFPRYWLLAFPAGTPSVSTGITRDGHPWIGAESPELTIVEYTDYRCFQCRKMHHFLRNLLERHPGKIRLVHRHFPLDKAVNPLVKTDIHPGSGILSKIAIYAQKQGKFWEANDYLYQYNIGQGAIFLAEIAEANGMDLDKMRTGIHQDDVRIKLARDIQSGLKNRITKTPSYVIDGNLFEGRIPPRLLKLLNE